MSAVHPTRFRLDRCHALTTDWQGGLISDDHRISEIVPVEVGGVMRRPSTYWFVNWTYVVQLSYAVAAGCSIGGLGAEQGNQPWINYRTVALVRLMISRWSGGSAALSAFRTTPLRNRSEAKCSRRRSQESTCDPCVYVCRGACGGAWRPPHSVLRAGTRAASPARCGTAVSTCRALSLSPAPASGRVRRGTAGRRGRPGRCGRPAPRPAPGRASRSWPAPGRRASSPWPR